MTKNVDFIVRLMVNYLHCHFPYKYSHLYSNVNQHVRSVTKHNLVTDYVCYFPVITEINVIKGLG